MLGSRNGCVCGLQGVRIMTSPQWIAERTYSTDDGLLTARVSQPIKEATGEWSCHIEVVGPQLHHSKAFGEDSLQALVLGLAKLRIVLSTDRKLRSLSWLGQSGPSIELIG